MNKYRSYPFLCVDFFLELADLRWTNLADLNLYRVSDFSNTVIFVKTEVLSQAIAVLLQIQKPFTLITGCNDDQCVPYFEYPCTDINTVNLHDSLLGCPFLIKWYSKNICIEHPKLCAIPIGPKMQWVSTQFFGEDNSKTIEMYKKYYLTPELNTFKPNLLYINMDVETTNYPFYKDHLFIRKNTQNLFLQKGFPMSQKKDIESYILDLRSHKFCLSPPGRGIDAHRTWEALMVGTIPICLSSSLDDLYRDLPVLIVNDYSCITEEFLMEQYALMQDKVYRYSLLYCDHWKTLIRGETYTAMILEPRKHPAMAFVLQNFLENLDSRWDFLIYHGTENEIWMKNLIEMDPILCHSKDRITFRNLGVKNLEPHEYSARMVSPDFIRAIPTEVFLVFQTDTMICKPYRDYIYDFIDYDYTGAPWAYSLGNDYDRGEHRVGNGGLSLRRRSKMLEVAMKVPYSPPYAEDMYFSGTLQMVKVKKPSFEEAKRFSIETVYSEKCFGVHKSWRWVKGVTEGQCPGYAELVRLNEGLL